MSSLFDEKEADQTVIQVLVNEITKLRSKLMPIVKTTDGKLYRVEAEQEISEADVQAELTELQNKVTELQALVTTPESSPSTDQAPAVGPDTLQAPLDPSTEAPADQPVDPATPPQGDTALPLN